MPALLWAILPTYLLLFLRKAAMALQFVKKWGNSPAVRLPAAVMEAAHLRLDQAVEVRAQNGRIVIEPAAPAYDLDALLAGITPQNRHTEQDVGSIPIARSSSFEPAPCGLFLFSRLSIRSLQALSFSDSRAAITIH